MTAQPLKSQIQDEELIRARRRQIFLAASRVLARKSFHEATVKEIALEAGIAAGSIYVYLQTKDDILFLMTESMVAEFVEMLPEIRRRAGNDPRAELLELMRAVMDVIDRYREAFAVVHHEVRYLSQRPEYRPALGRVIDQYVAPFAEALERGRAQGLLSFDEPRTAVQAIQSLCYGWAMGNGYLKEGGKENYWRQIVSIVKGEFFRAPMRRNARSRKPAALSGS